jgi:ABC-type xylose transport system permease subunit
MDLSKLTSNERTAVVLSAIVVVTGIISIANEWGALMFLAILAGLLVLAGILLPQASPSTNLPASTGVIILGGGVVAAVAFLITAVDWIEWIGEHLASFDTLQFLVGLIASLVLVWVGWRAYSEAGSAASAPPPPNPPA